MGRHDFSSRVVPLKLVLDEANVSYVSQQHMVWGDRLMLYLVAELISSLLRDLGELRVCRELIFGELGNSDIQDVTVSNKVL